MKASPTKVRRSCGQRRSFQRRDVPGAQARVGCDALDGSRGFSLVSTGKPCSKSSMERINNKSQTGGLARGAWARLEVTIGRRRAVRARNRLGSRVGYAGGCRCWDRWMQPRVKTNACCCFGRWCRFWLFFRCVGWGFGISWCWCRSAVRDAGRGYSGRLCAWRLQGRCCAINAG